MILAGSYHELERIAITVLGIARTQHPAPETDNPFTVLLILSANQ